MAGTPVSADDWNWKVQSATDALMKAEEVQRDAKLYAAARKELAKRAADATRALRKLPKAVDRAYGKLKGKRKGPKGA